MFAYWMENVPGLRARTQQPEVNKVLHLIDRLFHMGPAHQGMFHNVAHTGDAAERLCRLWTNMMTLEHWQLHCRMRRSNEIRTAQGWVEFFSSALSTVPIGPRTPFSKPGEPSALRPELGIDRVQLFPKFLADSNTFSQQIVSYQLPDGSQAVLPGPGMVHLVGSHEYYACPGRVRELVHNMLIPHITYCPDGSSVPTLHPVMQVRLTGNIVAPSTAWALMMAFRQQLRLTYPDDRPPPEAPLAAKEAGAPDAERAYQPPVPPASAPAHAARDSPPGTPPAAEEQHVKFAADAGSSAGAKRSSRHNWRERKGRAEAHPSKAFLAAKAAGTKRVVAATEKYMQRLRDLDDEANKDFREAKKAGTTRKVNILQLILMLYLLLQWGPVSYELGVGLGSLLMAQATMSASLWAWAQTRRVDAAKEVRFDSCFKERRRVLRSFMGTAGLSMGNPKFKGEPARTACCIPAS
jgi:hypothetical protein